MASKLLVVLVRDVKLTQIQDDQLKLVFDYILGIRQCDSCSFGASRINESFNFPIGSMLSTKMTIDHLKLLFEQAFVNIIVERTNSVHLIIGTL